MNKLLIFDLDGTLLDSMQTIVCIVQEVVEKLSAQNNNSFIIPSKRTIAFYIGRSSPEFYKSLVPKQYYHLIPKIRTMMRRKEWQLLRQAKVPLFPKVMTTLKKLHKYGFKMALCSNSSQRRLNIIAKAYRLKNYISTIHSAVRFEGDSKINVIRKIEKKFLTSKVIVIGDRDVDIEAANQAGAISIGVSYGYGGKQELHKADYIINHFSDLPKLLTEVL